MNVTKAHTSPERQQQQQQQHVFDGPTWFGTHAAADFDSAVMPQLRDIPGAANQSGYAGQSGYGGGGRGRAGGQPSYPAAARGRAGGGSSVVRLFSSSSSSSAAWPSSFSALTRWFLSL